MILKTTVMPNLKGRSTVNVVPTVDNVDYDLIYHYTSPEVIQKTFKFNKENRDVYVDNIKRIKRQIKDKEIGGKFIPPILVDVKTKEILDGQNRYQAFIEAASEGHDIDLRVEYTSVPNDYSTKLIGILQTGKKWQNRDYFHRAKKHGVVACSVLEDWCRSHAELCMDKNDCNRSYGMAFVWGKRMDKEVKDFTLTVNQDQLKYAEQIYKETYGIMKSMGYKRAAFMEGMVHAWYEIRKDKSTNYLIDTMGMDYVYNNIYREISDFQVSNTKKKEWLGKFHQAIRNLYHEYMTSGRV